MVNRIIYVDLTPSLHTYVYKYKPFSILAILMLAYLLDRMAGGWIQNDPALRIRATPTTPVAKGISLPTAKKKNELENELFS